MKKLTYNGEDFYYNYQGKNEYQEAIEHTVRWLNSEAEQESAIKRYTPDGIIKNSSKGTVEGVATTIMDVLCASNCGCETCQIYAGRCLWNDHLYSRVVGIFAELLPETQSVINELLRDKFNFELVDANEVI